MKGKSIQNCRTQSRTLSHFVERCTIFVIFIDNTNVQKLLRCTSHVSFQWQFVANACQLGVPGVLWHPQILADPLILSQPRGADYAHQVILAHPDFQTFRRPCEQMVGTVHKMYRNKVYAVVKNACGGPRNKSHSFTSSLGMLKSEPRSRISTSHTRVTSIVELLVLWKTNAFRI